MAKYIPLAKASRDTINTYPELLASKTKESDIKGMKYKREVSQKKTF